MPPFWNRKKKQESPPPTAEITFKTKVEQFWEWYAEAGERFYETIEAGRCGDLQPEVSQKVNELWPQFAWVFGPGPEEKGGHSFTLSGEGIRHRQFLTESWLEKAPDLPNWTFYASRQPGEIHDGMAIQIGEDEFRFGELWITPELDEENEQVQVTAWHPQFPKVDEQKKDTVLFLILDEVLGEYGTDQWLGVIETNDEKLAGAIPVGELREYLHDLEIEKGWTKLPPTESGCVYQLNEPDDRFLRSDTFVGSTMHMPLIDDYLGSEGQMEDPIAGSGAEFVFVAFPSAILPEGGETDFRGAIADKIEASLECDGAGSVLGGASGVEQSYIDLLILDGQNSLNRIREILVAEGLPSGTGIHFFAKGNEGRRIVL